MGIVVWVGICVILGTMRSAQGLLAVIVSGEKSGVIQIGLPLYVTWHFFLTAFNILSLFSTFVVLIIMCWEEFLFKKFKAECNWCSLMSIVLFFSPARAYISPVDCLAHFMLLMPTWKRLMSITFLNMHPKNLNSYVNIKNLVLSKFSTNSKHAD